MRRGLSKSKILSGLQCPKRLYLEVNRPELAAVDEAAERNFSRGHLFGEVARGLFPGGVLIGPDGDLRAALAETRKRLTSGAGEPLFEATLDHEGVLVRADVLIPIGDQYDLIEVKSSTEVKDYHLPDCTVQAWTIESAGFPLRRIEVGHVDKTFVYREEGNFEGLLAREDVTEAVRAQQAEVPRWVSGLREVLARDCEPQVMPGAQCSDPFDCPFQSYCDPITAVHPISTLPRIQKKKVAALRAEGFEDIRDVPDGRLTNPKHQWVRQVVLSGKLDLSPAAAEVIDALAYPRYYLDFETIQFVVPRWLGTRPYEQLPFQWSCHVERADGTLEHLEFLDTSGEAPMRAFAESLLTALGAEGPILVYNAGFENRILRELATRFVDLSDRLLALTDRVVDLLPITRDHYYHPDMHGSWSIKAVLPTVAPDLTYSDLGDVHHGGEAQDAYLECIAPETGAARRKALEAALREYCALDTMAMVRLARFLAGGGTTGDLPRRGSRG